MAPFPVTHRAAGTALARTLACAFTLAACDRVVAPRSVARPLGRLVYGDFVMPVADVTLPDTVHAGDSIDVPLHFAGGVDPCVRGPGVWLSDDYATVAAVYGIDSRSAPCRAAPLRVVVPAAAERSGERVFRLVICRADGAHLRRQAVVVWRESDPPFALPPPDSVAALWKTEAEAGVTTRCTGLLSAVR